MANFAYIYHQNSTIHVGKSSSPMIIFTRGNTTSKKHIFWFAPGTFTSHGWQLNSTGRAYKRSPSFFDRLWAPQTVAGEMAAAFLCLSKNLKSTLEWIAKHHPKKTMLIFWTTWKSESLYKNMFLFSILDICFIFGGSNPRNFHEKIRTKKKPCKLQDCTEDAMPWIGKPLGWDDMKSVTSAS